MYNNTSTDIDIIDSAPDLDSSKMFKVLLYSKCYLFPLKLSFQYVVEGILMTSVACLGIISNMISLLYFLYQKYHKTFHRSEI